MKGLSHARPKGVARIKTELIDLDLIRGSAFTKAKPQQGFIATTYLGIIRVLLFPFYLKWWSNQTNRFICTLLSVLYGLQLSSMYIYFNYHSLVSDSLPSDGNILSLNNSSTSSSTSHSHVDGAKITATRQISTDFDEIPASEVLVPVVMFVILSVIQSNIAASHSLDERNRRNHPGSRTRSRSQLTDEGVDVQTRARTASIRLPQHSSQSSKKNSVSCQNPIKRRKRRSPEKKIKEVRILDSSSNDGVQVVPEPQKKPSDDESGLEIPESFVDHVDQARCQRRNSKSAEFAKTSDKNPATGARSNGEKSSTPIEDSNRSSPIKDQESSNLEASVENTPGSEGDHEGEDDDAHVDDMSSQDEMSPYSTVNSLETNHWYGDYVSQRCRTFSQSTVRRFSNPINETHRRQRSNTILRNCSLHKVQPLGSSFSKLQMPAHTHSSCDSEGSMSPTTPNKGVTTDMDWPMINSEVSSEEDDDEEVVNVTPSTAQSPPKPMSAPVAVEKNNLGESDLYTGPISAPPFYYPDDPDSLPPTIFSFCDDWMLGSRNCDKKNNDKGKEQNQTILLDLTFFIFFCIVLMHEYIFCFHCQE